MENAAEVGPMGTEAAGLLLLLLKLLLCVNPKLPTGLAGVAGSVKRFRSTKPKWAVVETGGSCAVKILVGEDGLLLIGDAGAGNRFAYSLLGEMPGLAGARAAACVGVAAGLSNDVLSVDESVVATESVSKYWNDLSLIVSEA